MLIYDKSSVMCIYDPSSDNWLDVYKDEEKYWKFRWVDKPCPLSLDEVSDIREKSLPKLGKGGRQFLYIPTEYLKILFWERFDTNFKEAETDLTIDEHIDKINKQKIKVEVEWAGPS